jgi:hypothetical protein
MLETVLLGVLLLHSSSSYKLSNIIPPLQINVFFVLFFAKQNSLLLTLLTIQAGVSDVRDYVWDY